MERADWIWMNGKLVAWDDARLHVASHVVHYGTGVFEGIRAYGGEQGTAIFRLDEHLARLRDSARLLHMELPFTHEQLRAACCELVAANGFADCYLRPIAYLGYGSVSVQPAGIPVEVAIMAYERSPLGARASAQEGLSVMVSSWKRVGANTIPHTSKAAGAYLNALLAGSQARRAGYDEALLLADDGTVADGAVQNVFAVRDGRIATPELSTSILPGITRATAIELARARGWEVQERPLLRAELQLADEVFLTGTACEIVPVRAVEDQQLGVGPVTLALQAAYEDVVRGRVPERSAWLCPVP